MALTYLANYNDIIKRLRRYQGKVFGNGSPLGRFAFSVWAGSNGHVLIVDKTGTRIPLLPGVTPSGAYWPLIIADQRINSDPPGFSSRG